VTEPRRTHQLSPRCRYRALERLQELVGRGRGGDRRRRSRSRSQGATRASRDIACTDYTVAHAGAVAAELVIDRLRGVIPALQAKLHQASAQEYRERWLADYHRVEAQREAAAKSFKRYPDLVAELIDIFRCALAISTT
jgi:hypothetical protein